MSNIEAKSDLASLKAKQMKIDIDKKKLFQLISVN